MQTCASCGRTIAEDTTLCTHCGAPTTDEPAVGRVRVTYEGRPPVEQGPLPPLEVDAGSRRPAAVEWLFAADWRPAGLVAGPTVLVAFALGLVAAAYLILFGSSSDDDSLGLNHSAGGFVHVGVGHVAMAFGSPLFSHASGDDGSYAVGGAPLTISILVLLAFGLMLRVYLPATGTSARLTAGLRAAMLTAAGLAVLSIGV